MDDHLPLLAENRHSPIKYNIDPMRKIMSMVKAYASMPRMINGSGRGGSGGGVGHDPAQSIHEQAGVLA